MQPDPLSQVLGTLNLLGAVHGFFLAGVVAFGKQRGHLASKLLAGFVLSFSLIIAGTMLGALGYYRTMPHLIRIGDPFVWTLGPLLYLYVVAVRNGQIKTVHWLHLAPFAIYAIYMIATFYALPAGAKIAFVEDVMTRPDAPYWTLTVVRLVYNGAYVGLVLTLLSRHRAEVEEAHSEISSLSLDWIRKLTYALLIVLGVAVFFYLLAFAEWIVFLQANYLIAFVMSVIVYAMGYIGMTQPELHGELISVKQNDAPVSAKAVFPDDRVQKVFSDLKLIMQRDRLYLDSSLNIQQLSDHINQPKYLVSTAINDLAGMNFHDFVNAYRIEEVKRRLKDPAFESYTVLAIAMDSGFNSKSSFNAAFRKHTGQTPSAFKASLQEA